ncbi:MAG: hypothetical protein ACYDD1_02610 [Caulobacteraceae bacterium]
MQAVAAVSDDGASRMQRIIVSLMLAATAAQAQEPGPTPAGADTTVSGVTVTIHRPTPVAGVVVTANACPEPDAARFSADPAPMVVDTYPAPGSVVAPGALVLQASFNAPMSCYWEVTSESDGGDDPCRNAGRWPLPARTTWIMDCTLKPNAHYTLRFGKADGEGFVGRSGRAAPPYVLSFSTSDQPPVTPADAQRLSLAGTTPAPAYVVCSAAPDVAGADCVRVSGDAPP